MELQALCSHKGIQSKQKSTQICLSEFMSDLQLEAKIIVYGWLFHRSSTRSRPAKFSSIESRCNTPLNEIFSFLAENKHDSIVALNQTGVWQSFLAWVQAKDRSHISVGHVLRTLRFIAKNACWHNIRLILPEFKVDDLAGRLCHNERRTHQQILALPQSVADTLYGEAIRFVESAWPHRLALEETERRLQENYLQAKSIVDAYLAEGHFPALVNPEGEITDKHRYSLTIKSFLRERVQDTIHSCLGPSGLLPGEKADGDWLKKFRGQLLTSCFICCAAFSGMRLSELFELTKDSFHTEVIGRNILPSERQNLQIWRKAGDLGHQPDNGESHSTGHLPDPAGPMHGGRCKMEYWNLRKRTLPKSFTFTLAEPDIPFTPSRSDYSLERPSAGIFQASLSHH